MNYPNQPPDEILKIYANAEVYGLDNVFLVLARESDASKSTYLQANAVNVVMKEKVKLVNALMRIRLEEGKKELLPNINSQIN